MPEGRADDSRPRGSNRALAAVTSPLPPRWPWLFGLFRRYVRRYVAKHLHAVRISNNGPAPRRLNGPTIIALNHPSWWDPLLCFVLSGIWGDRVDWGVIDSAGLRQYRFLSRVGLFGADGTTTRGAAAFLRTGRAILGDSRATLWITAQGRFADVRERPVILRSGVGHLAAAIDHATIVPMALEYPFWDQRGPEALIHFGSPIAVDSGARRSPREWTMMVTEELERAMNVLSRDAVNRDASLFTLFLQGQTGVGGLYDFGRRMRAWAEGRRFDPGHRSE